MKTLFILVCLLINGSIVLASPLPQLPSDDVLQKISELNQEQALRDSFRNFTRRSENVVPFAEYEETGYVFFNDDDYWGYAREIKQTIASELPANVKLVVYTTSENKSDLRRLEDYYGRFIDPARLLVLQVPRSGSNDFWTRDNLPLPVWTDDQFTLVDARYYYNFEPDAFLKELFQSLSTKHNYFFEGGNFIANSLGDCIVVNRRKRYPGGVSDTGAIPDEIFENHYGCKRLTRLRHLKGIGHADEVVKFMSDNVIVTDTEEYVETLESLGYEVHILPEPRGRFETYVNSLQVNDVLFVPTFGGSTDQEAIEVYEALNTGLKIVPIDTSSLANGGQGGIHCITMNYPPVPMIEMLRALGY
jgi:agmatine/peptidylarginine deiminase